MVELVFDISSFVEIELAAPTSVLMLFRALQFAQFKTFLGAIFRWKFYRNKFVKFHFYTFYPDVQKKITVLPLNF